MTNEWQEFLDYTTVPVYKADSKKDTTFLSRMLIDIFAEFNGLDRILTIVARGYLFHNSDGSIKNGNPYDRADYAADALKAWCSIPDRSKKQELSVDFRELNEQFPELVDKKGNGWFCSHEKNVIKFIEGHPERVRIATFNKAEKISDSFTVDWKKKVRQFQVPIFASNTKGAWTLRFDDIVAAALDSGPLRMEDYKLPKEIESYIDNYGLSEVPAYVVKDVAAFCLANSRPDTDWVILPVTNFNYYYGNVMFEKKWLKKIPQDIILRDVSKHGVCRVKFTARFLFAT